MKFLKSPFSKRLIYRIKKQYFINCSFYNNELTEYKDLEFSYNEFLYFKKL